VLDAYLRPLIDEGKTVVIFAHSFGATTLPRGAETLAKAAREAEGKAGGVLGLVYNSLAMVTEGVSQFAYTGGQWPPLCLLDKVKRFHSSTAMNF